MLYLELFHDTLDARAHYYRNWATAYKGRGVALPFSRKALSGFSASCRTALWHLSGVPHAAIRPQGFGSWRAAIAAGLNYDEVARYKYWHKERVLREIKELHYAGKFLSVSEVERYHRPLLWAARRRFTSWNDALTAAGIDPAQVQPHPPCSPSNGSLIFGSLETSLAAQRDKEV